MFKFKVGDEMIITSGKDKGKKGKIEKIIRKEDKVLASGLNTYKRHRKATRSKASGIFEFARPISTAAVAIICPKCGKQTRVGFFIEGKNKHRICKKCSGRLT